MRRGRVAAAGRGGGTGRSVHEPEQRHRCRAGARSGSSKAGAEAGGGARKFWVTSGRWIIYLYLYLFLKQIKFSPKFDFVRLVLLIVRP